MTCSLCQHENRSGAKFCEECAAPLPRPCASCGAHLRASAKFCDECGTATGAAPVPTPATDADGTRKVVTVVFADLAGSTALHERLDAESARRFMEGYYRAMRGAVEQHGGRVAKLLGDGVMAVCGLPMVAEDDALRAVRAAVDMQRVFRELAERHSNLVGKVGLRVAVNTGEVVAKDETELIGDPVNVAARLQDQARDGDVVIGESTRRLVATLVTLEPLGSLILKGRDEAVGAYRVVSLEKPVSATTAAFVGREDELARLAAVLDSAIGMPAARLAVLLGSPGLGKSRLIDEFALRHAETARILTAHCEAAGGTTFAPLAKAIRTVLGLDDPITGEPARAAIAAALSSSTDDAEIARVAGGVAALLGGAPTSPEETFFVVRRFLSGLASARPVVLVIDDLQWAEPLLLDLVEHLVQWGGGVRLLVLVGARPELRDLRSTLATAGGLVADVVTLGGLDAGAAMRLAANVIGATDLPAAVAVKVLAASEGNPLFVGELVRMLVQEGALTKEGDRWTTGAGLAALEMPPTIHALLAARIERLRPDDRTVLERAAVVGRQFSRSAVAALLGRNDSDLDARLESLRRSELIERDTGWLLGDPALRFHHLLIRDAAYRRLLKGTRAELHERLADWIDVRVGGAPEHDETIGWHLEQAHQHLRELGSLDERGRRLGERASQRLAAAGRRALARDDVPLAASLLGRAIDRLVPDAPDRAALALDWCEALLSAGDVGPAGAAIDELGRVVADSARLRAWHTCFAGQLTVLTAPEALQATAEHVGAAARDLATLGDAAGEAKAHFVHAQALARLGKVGACEAALDLALAAARRAGDRRRANAVLAGAPLAALWGPSPVTRASGRCLDVVRVLRITQGAPAVEAVALSCQGVLEALRGRTDAARRMIGSARTMVEELGIAHRLFEADAFAGRIDLLEGDAAAAERSLRGAYEGLRDLGLGIDAARAAALLARALLAQERIAEAEACSRESEALAGDDLQAAIAWRGARAEALAKRGDHADAVALAQAAVTIAAATDALLDHADARVALAAALRAAGRGAEADAEEHRAIELWEAKGATLLAERARKGGADAAPLPGGSEPRVARSPAARRAVRENAATAWQARFDAALAARDFDAARALTSEDYQEIDHPTGSCYGSTEAFGSLQRLFRSRDPLYREELFATLGDTLCLRRRLVRASGAAGRRYDVGAYENEAISLLEVDDRGLAWRHEVFAVDQLGAAVERLYERYAELLPDGPARERAAATARAMATQSRAESDLDRWAAVLAPDFESIDHRRLGTWSLRGASAFLDHLRALREVASEIMFRDHAVIALEPNAVLVERMHSGNDRLGGGTYERLFLVLFVTDVEGRLACAEWFDADHDVEALARFDALVAGEMPKRTARLVRRNAATRNAERVWAAVEQRDEAALLAAHAASMEVIHHPTGATYGMAGVLALYRGFWRGQNLRLALETLGTLGDSLALWRHSYAHDGFDAKFGSVGPVEGDYFVLSEVDGRELRKRTEVFAADRLGDAVARLYERYAELLPEGPARTRAAGAARVVAAFHRHASDPDPLAAVFAPAIVAVDHRTVGFGELHGRDAVVTAMRALHYLADDVIMRLDDVLALSDRASVIRATQRGRVRASGGAFERRFCSLRVHDADGLLARWEIFEPEQEDEALARYDALVGTTDRASSAPEPPFANAASRAWLTVLAAWAGRDAEGFAALHPRPLRYRDHRRLFHLDLDREQFLDFTRPTLDIAVRASAELLATRGERRALKRFTMDMAEDAVGPSAIDSLLLIETDEGGDIIGYDRFDSGDTDAAWAALDARWVADQTTPERTVAEAVRSGFDAFTRRDWNAYTAVLAPGVGVHDHRLFGWGTVLDDGATLVRSQQALVDLAPDVRYRLDHFRSSGRVHLVQAAQEGTRDGGPFESPLLIVGVHDAAGRLLRFDLYDVDQLDQARARFEAFAAAADPLAAIAKPNVPFALERWLAAFDAGIASDDWDAMRDLCAAGMIFDDRRRLALLSGDRDLMIASARERERSGGRPEFRLVGTAGDRVAVSHVLWSGGPPEGRWEVEYLSVVESDEAGRLTAMIFFDLDDARAAQREAWGRWAAIDPCAAPWVSLIGAAVDFFDEQDGSRLRALFADDVVVDDHRRTGFGRIEGADAYLQSLAVLWDLAPDQRMELGWFWPAVERHGVITLLRRSGALAGGGAFESEHLWLCTATGGRITRLELFEVEDLERAKARLEELRPDPLRIPPNAVTRTWDGWCSAVAANDRDAIPGLYAPAYRFDDRRRLFRMSADLGQTLAGDYLILEDGWQPVRTLLATAGDRLALQHILWTTGEAGATSEIETLMVSEVDGDGRFVHGAAFDPADRAAASTELFERYVASGAAGLASNVIEIGRAWNAHDLERLRALLPDDFYLDDRRRTGVGRLEGLDAYLDSLSAVWELSRDLRIEILYIIGTAAHGILYVCRWSGTNAEGGDFDAVYVCIGLLRDGETAGLEISELDDLDAALARFEALRPDPLRIPPNAATRWNDRWSSLGAARDCDALGALYAPDVLFDDRRRLLRTTGDRETALASGRLIWGSGSVHLDRTLLATAGDRLALERWSWRGGETGDDFAGDLLALTEVDGHGLVVAWIFFDPDDCRAAYIELAEHHLRNTRPATVRKFVERRAAGRDLARLRASFADDFFFRDHRRTGLGRLEDADAYLASVAALFELSPDAMVGQVLYLLADEPHATLSIARSFGTLAQGGDFEAVYVMIMLYGSDDLAGVELFELDNRDAALARFEELRPVPSHATQ
jgi:class 3 adenylate cyclase/ketosteroid isomerase-like protein